MSEHPACLPPLNDPFEQWLAETDDGFWGSLARYAALTGTSMAALAAYQDQGGSE